jgi:GT2 family glycosyltransferase/SAM-dependent methyltransferase
VEWTGERFIPWMEGSQIHYEHLHRYMFAKTLTIEKEVLDLACGEGYGSYILSETAKKVIGIDSDEETIRHATSKYFLHNLTFICGHMEKIPIKGKNLFDSVVCFEAIEHTDKHEETLSEIKRVLREDGFLIISTPNKVEYRKAEEKNPYHLKEMDLYEFLELLKRYFRYVVLFGQRVYAGSYIWKLQKSSNFGNFLEFLIERKEEFHHAPYYKKIPVYFIAVASDVELSIPYTNSFLIDVDNCMLKEPYTKIEEEEKKISILRKEIEEAKKERDENIEKLSKEIRERDENIEKLSKEIRERDENIEKLSKEKNEIIEKLSKEIEGFYASTSWRITAPLRAAKRAIVRIIQLLKLWFRWSSHRMTLHTLRDLIPEGNEIFRSGGNSPQFVISSNKKHLPSGWIYISLSIEYLDVKEISPSPKLVPDNWSGFKEELAVSLPFVKKGKIKTVAKFPERVRAIRFDPCNSSGVFLVKKLKIVEIGKLQVGILLLWRLIKPFLLHPAQLIRNIIKAVSILKSGGFNTLKEKVVSKATHQWEIEPSPSKKIEFSAKSEEWSPWEDYYLLSKRIKEIEKERLNNLTLIPPKIFNIDERKLKNYIEKLDFPHYEAPLVSIIIPVHNNIKLTIECLLSIITYTKEIPYEIIIVDDASTDETEALLSKVKNINYMRNSERKGFVHSCNNGAKMARGKFIVLLNNDTQVTENWLPPLINTFVSHERTGVVSPKIIYPNGRLQEAGCLINPDGSTKLIGLFDDPNLPRYNYIKEVDYSSAVCMVIKKELFDEIGGFDEDFSPGYCEDVDLCLKVRSRGFRILYNPNSVVVHHLSATYGKIEPSYKFSLIISNQQKLCEKWQKEIDNLNRIKLIAFYLPQYHPIIENDIWWGTGFTDWNKVVSAKPNFVGHYQPHIPSDSGFYDLRVLEVMEQQAELAKKYGIYGFCFYYYWFGGKRLLEMPLERLLATGKPDIPFCLCWANENWTRRWDGMDNEILMAQSYDDDVAVIKDVMRYMRHPNYIRIKGKPLFLVYRVNLFPDIKKTVSVWREVCKKDGIGEIYLAMVNSFENAIKNPDPRKYGFDASVEFPPHGFAIPIPPPGEILNPDFKGVVSDYRETVLKYIQKEIPAYIHFRSVLPNWDNTPRRQNDGYIFHYSSPGAYQAWLEKMIEITREQNGPEERIIFINAWNEWGEGCHLEPDRRFGHGYLEATRNALEKRILCDEGE